MLYIDLDRFKVVNDSLGHLVGDALLIAVSRRLESCLRQGDALARLGGDEFAILLNELGDEQQANAIAFRIQHALSRAVLDRRAAKCSRRPASASRSAASQYDSPEEIMRDADTAMYHAKARGKARHELFDADMHARVRDRLGLENDLRHAVGQPRLRGALPADRVVEHRDVRRIRVARPLDAERRADPAGDVHSDRRGARADRTARHLGVAAGLPHVRGVAAAVPGLAGLECITVNVSNRQLMEQNFLLIVEEAVHGAGLAPCDLRLEITETALMDSPHVVADVLRELRDFGVKIYLDDFGTGYSSLSHLHKLPVDALKIDRSFVKSLLLPDRPAIVESILALARTLNTSVVAEGIESEVQARELERLGCTHAQGFLFSRPLTVEDAEGLLRANQPLGPKRERRQLATSADPEPDRYRLPARHDWS